MASCTETRPNVDSAASVSRLDHRPRVVCDSQRVFLTAYYSFVLFGSILVHGEVTIIFVVSVCLSVCLFVCAEFFSAVFDPISIKLGHMLSLYVWV